VIDYNYDGSRDEAVGWLIAALGGPAIAAEAHRARRSGYTKVADHLLGWADGAEANLTIVDIADRRRHRSRFDLLDFEALDEAGL
jgi:hypothetical protein